MAPLHGQHCCPCSVGFFDGMSVSEKELRNVGTF
jgi:hypothetical protein